MLTECCHLAQCLLLSVCMVLTSSVAKFCQVWSGLTFSLSRHVYSSPIPLKYTLSAHLSACSINLHCILWLSMYFLILLLTLIIILCNTLCLITKTSNRPGYRNLILSRSQIKRVLGTRLLCKTECKWALELYRELK